MQQRNSRWQLFVEQVRSRRTGRIDSLDGLRGVLALEVVYYHLMGGIPLAQDFAERHTSLLMQSWLSVDIFFVMSGFVLTYVYRQRFAQKVTLTSYVEFMNARFARLMPVNLFVLSLMFATILPAVVTSERFLSLDGRYAWSAAIASVFMMQGPWIDHRTWNYPTWSLSVEWHLYVVFPWLLWVVNRKATAVAAIAFGILAALTFYWSVGPETNGLLTLLRGLGLFVVGIGIYAIWTDKRMDSLVIPCVGLLIIVPLLMSHDPYLALIGVPLLILGTLRNRVLSSLLSTRPLRFLGIVSYSLYMVHALVQIVILNRIYERMPLLHNTAGAVIAVLCGVALSVVLAALMVAFVENPAREWLRDRLPQRGPRDTTQERRDPALAK